MTDSPPLADSPRVRLRLFGAVEIECDGRRIDAELRRKAVWLLALLALRRGAPIERGLAAATLWPESAEERARYNLRRELSALRRALGASAAALVVADQRDLRLDPAGVDGDVAAFDAAIARDDEASLAAAVALRRGPLLEDCVEDWALAERERRDTACVLALERLARLARERDDAHAAEAWITEALALDPLRESLHRERMALFAARGDRAAAISAYRELRRALREALGVEPDPRTAALLREIQSGPAHGRAEVEGAARHAGTARAAAPAAHPAAAPRPVLPAPLTALVGRTNERAAALEALTHARLVTLAGPAGVGKTRLALAVAADSAERRVDGAAFVPLAKTRDAALLDEFVTASLGLLVAPGTRARDVLVAHLRTRDVVLVFDNCEHLGAECAAYVAALLADAPRLRILATSRQSLGIAGEVVQRLRPLAVPPGDGARLEAGARDAFDGVRLFVERARAANPRLDLDADADRAIVAICVRLEGLPLALELAAARTRSLSLAEIAAGLSDALGMLDPVRGTVADHQRTLTAAMDWSHALLASEEREVLRRVAVFAGPFTSDAAAEVCADERLERARVLPALDGLVDKSMLVHETSGDAPSRYRLLEIVRQYARHELERAGELELVAERHLDHFAALARDASPHLFGGFTDEVWRARLVPAHADLRRALERCDGRPDRAARAVRLAADLQWFWFAEGAFAEAHRRLDAALRDAGDPSGDRGRALVARSYVAFWEGDPAGVRGPAEEALALARAAADARGIAYAASILACAPGDADAENARALADEALHAARTHGDDTLTSIVLWWRGLLQEMQADPEGAEASYLESLELIRAVGHATGTGHVLYPLGRVRLALGDLDGAARCFDESWDVLAAIGNRWGMSAAAAGRAFVALRGGRPEDAARLFGVVDALREAVGARATPAEAAEEEAAREELARALGDAQYEALGARGRAEAAGE